MASSQNQATRLPPSPDGAHYQGLGHTLDKKSCIIQDECATNQPTDINADESGPAHAAVKIPTLYVIAASMSRYDVARFAPYSQCTAAPLVMRASRLAKLALCALGGTSSVLAAARPSSLSSSQTVTRGFQ
jgi:hypothetical protein